MRHCERIYRSDSLYDGGIVGQTLTSVVESVPAKKRLYMWMSADKRRALARETSDLPYLAGASKQEAEEASQLRSEILEQVFDQFIRPDDSDFDASAPSRWNRALQLWRTLLTEKRGLLLC